MDFQVRCTCGQEFLAKADQVGERVQCQACATWLKITQWQDPQTQEIRIQAVESRLNRLPAVPQSKQSVSDATVQYILCNCGESLAVESSQVGKETQCPACGTTMCLEMRPDPETSKMVISPRIVGTGGAHQSGIDESISLDDFK